MNDATSPLTGVQHELTSGDQTAVVTEVGATLRSYDVGGRPVVDGFTAEEMAHGCRGQVLAPWPNRVRDGVWTWEGETLQLALTEPARHNAIHGLVRWQAWVLEQRGEDWVSLTTTIWPQDGYPFLMGLRATYRLGDDGLAVALSARNIGDRPAPYGAGFHGYVAALTDRVDDTVLTLPARTRITTDDRLNPVGTEPVAGSAYDFTTPRAVGDLVLDDAFADLLQDAAGRVTVSMTDPTGRTGTSLWGGPATRYLQVFSGDTLADPRRRRRSLAVEPMTCPADAFVSGESLLVLAPGEEHELTWGIHSW